MQGSPGRVERVAFAATVAVDDLLDPAAALIERVAGQVHDVEGVHDRDRVGQFLGGGGLEPGEPVHRDHLHRQAPGLGAVGEPGLEGLLGAALDHVEQPGRTGAVADASEVDDHRHVFVPAARVPPDVLVHADHGNAVEPAWIVDQHAFAFGKNRVVRGVPRHPKTLSHPGHGQVLNDDGFQSPPQPTPRQLRPRLSCLGRVLAPHAPTPTASVAAHRHVQGRGTPAHRFVGQPPDHAVANSSFAAAAPAPAVSIVGAGDSAGQHRPAGLESLPDDFETELVKACERGQVRADEGSVRHVEAFWMRRVGTFIFGRPRPLPRQRRAHPLYTLNCEEPLCPVCANTFWGS
ncbi:hypothetical protein EV651_11265 [Kribbella sp. VKM Ac-2571]|nr:hypothetical protein EV651_11265 [Kribbella sp. VKM Ac-2571]